MITAFASIVLLASSVGELPNSQMDGGALARRMNEEGPQARANLSECYRSNVLRLGAGNSESADTLLRGVRSICEPFESRLNTLYAPEIVGKAAAAAAVGRDRAKAEGAAIAALLEARASR